MLNRLTAALMSFGLTLMASPAFAQVYVGPNSNIATLTDPITLSYSTPYSMPEFGAGSIAVNPDISASLATGVFKDSVGYSGSSNCPGNGCSAIVDLPGLLMQDSFVITSPNGADIPWKMSLTTTAHFSGSGLDQIDQRFDAGGNINPSATTSNFTCFTNYSAGCGNPNSTLAPSDVAKTVTLSGTVMSGQSLAFSLSVFGSSVLYWNFGPSATSFEGALELDPLIQVILPKGTTVQSASGVFPVTFADAVPEPSSSLMLLAGLGGLWGWKRHHQSRSCQAVPLNQ